MTGPSTTRSTTPRPSIAQLRPVCQPESTLSRRNAEHWLAVLLLRRWSLWVTRELLRTPVSANQVTGVMIVVGLLAALPAAIPGAWTAALALVGVLAYFVLDLCDGEIARWRRQTSVTGVYLDRVGHYVVEAALLVAYGVRAGDGEFGGWSTLGAVGGILVIVVKAETDLVDASRARAGLGAASDQQAGLRRAGIGRLRRVASVLRIHQLTGALESAALLVVAAVLDTWILPGDLLATRALVVALVGVAATMSVLHLVSVLASNRLR